MDQDTDITAAEAFYNVRGEIALLRRAVERLAAERAEMPDYTETLAHTDRAMTALAQRVNVLAKSPALSLTPEAAAAQITAAAAKAHAEDQRIIAAACAALDQATGQLGGYVLSARKADQQDRWLLGLSAGGIAFGLLLWATFAGPIARAVPESWHWPEQRAARALDMPMWQAGQRLMATANPTAFRALDRSDRLVTTNRTAIERCANVAKTTGSVVRCSILLGPDSF